MILSSCLRLGVVAGCLMLGACAAALEFATAEPPRLYELTPKSTFANDLPTVSGRLSVEVPSATAGLNSARIALRPTPTTLEYYAGATHIREFQAEYEKAGAPQVRVRLQARLIRLPRRTSLAATSAEFAVRARNNSLSAIIDAFDEAFGKALKRIVEWTVQESAAAHA